MVPDRRGPVLVRVLEGGEPGPPVDAVGPGGLAREELVPGAFPRVARRDVVRGRQVPGFGVAVAVVGHADSAMHMGDDRHRARVATRRLRERRPAVPVGGATGRVRPVQRRVDREQMRQEVPVPSTSSLIHLTRTGRFHIASIVSEGALWISSPRLLCAAFAPYPHTVVAAGPPAGSAARTAASRSRSSRPACRPAA